MTRGGDGKLSFSHKDIAASLIKNKYPKIVAQEFGCSQDLVWLVAKEYNIKVLSRGVCNVNLPKQVQMLDKDTKEVILNFQSVQDAGLWLLHHDCISCLNSGVRAHISHVANNHRKSAYGFCWKYIG